MIEQAVMLQKSSGKASSLSSMVSIFMEIEDIIDTVQSPFLSKVFLHSF